MKILLVVSKKITALQYFRQDMPHDALKITNPDFTFGKVTSDVPGFPDVMQIPEEELAKYDIVSYLRQISYDRQINIDTVNYLRNKRKKIIFDIDDWWRVPRTHAFFPHYEKHNIPEIIEHTLGLVDAVTTTNGYLADKIEPFNENVWVLPNAINPEEKQFTKRKIESSLIRFGWVGGVHHLADMEIMRQAMRKANLLPNVQICLGGFNLSGPEYFEMEKILTDGHRSVMGDREYIEYLAAGTPAMEHVGFFKPYRRLWARDINNYADIYNDLDVVLAPLVDNNFNRCKSELKLIEAGWMGKCVIASDIYPYNEVIEHGVDGFLVSPQRGIDWYLFMKRLSENPDLIKSMSEKFEKKIRELFDIHDINKIRLDLYKNIL